MKSNFNILPWIRYFNYVFTRTLYDFRIISEQSVVNRWKVYFRTRRNLSIRSENTWCGILGVPRKFCRPPTFTLCKGAPGFFSSMNDDVWMLALGIGGTVKGSIVASSPGERTHSAPQGRPSWNITAEQQTAHILSLSLFLSLSLSLSLCWLYTVNFMPDFLPTPSNSTLSLFLFAALAFLAVIPWLLYKSPWSKSANNNKYSSNYSRKQHQKKRENNIDSYIF